MEDYKQLTKTAIARDGYLSKTEVAERLGRTPRTLEQWMKRGWLPYLKIGRSVLFHWPTIERHLNENFLIIRRPVHRPMRVLKPGHPPST